MTRFIDSNVVLDLLTDDPHWRSWSEQQLEAVAGTGGGLFNDIVSAEASVRYATLLEVEDAFHRLRLIWTPTPRPALFSAAKAFQRYRRSGGTRTNVLPDFIIGAHADALQVPLVTRDVTRYRTYFPQLALISPAHIGGGEIG